mmetsp:Transcript_23006/g.51139  ORF Transcript_23006/g.51139 Transcript_23006/m.51139 type:complete len:207 (-) Transcript_23006:470-1090(-)
MHNGCNGLLPRTKTQYREYVQHALARTAPQFMYERRAKGGQRAETGNGCCYKGSILLVCFGQLHHQRAGPALQQTRCSPRLFSNPDTRFSPDLSPSPSLSPSSVSISGSGAGCDVRPRCDSGERECRDRTAEVGGHRGAQGMSQIQPEVSHLHYHLNRICAHQTCQIWGVFGPQKPYRKGTFFAHTGVSYVHHGPLHECLAGPDLS